MTDRIATNIQQVQSRIRAAQQLAGRTSDIVQLLAVSKTRSAAEIRIAHDAGLTHFGENYLQEALTKQTELADLSLTWHFIGPIQSNKTAAIAAHFDWVQSIDRLKIAQRLSQQRPAGMAPLNLCIQLNISQEATKSGASLEELPALAAAVAQLPNLKLRGLMAIPDPELDEAALRTQFRAVATARAQLNAQGLGLDTLSMGMSNDLECAIAEGATLVRIGTDIFGPRPRKD